MMGRTSSLLLRGALALFLGGATGQDSCVQVSNSVFASSCPCEADGEYTFQIEGLTTVAANTVNVAVIIDASGSVTPANFLLEKEFAKDAVASFASRNLFENGGTASFAQFNTRATEGGTFTSSEEYDAFVDADPRASGLTIISTGIARGRELLNANPATASFLILITDGENSASSDNDIVAIESDAARAEGTIVYAVGVGSVSEETLLLIGGDPANVFGIEEFTELDSALDDIIAESAGSIPCAATDAVITVEFNAVVLGASAGGDPAAASFEAGSSVVVFEVANLEATPTAFEVMVDACGGQAEAPIVASVSYADAGGNTPDLGTLEETGSVPLCEDDDEDGGTVVVEPPTPAPVDDEDGGTVVVEPPTPAPVDDEGLSYSFSYTYESFDDDGSDNGMVCSNGVYGVESSNGLVCCDAGCGTCGGVGCSKFGAPDLGAYDCCVTEILDFGEPCTETATAPCFIDDHWPEPIVVPPMPETADTSDETPVPGMMCSNGVPGVESTNGAACCDAACGFCGGSGCSRAGGPGLGANDCCSTEIVFFGEACSESKTAPCFIDGPVVITPTVAPTVTAPVDPVDDMSYSYTFEYLPEDSFEYPDSTFEYPEDDDGMMCSNGVVGIESSNGLACCAAGCGQCGGVGCSQAGGPNLGADDCCTTEILDFGWACSVTGIAPCVIDGDVVAPGPTPMMPAPTPETVEEIVTDTYSYDYDLSYMW